MAPVRLPFGFWLVRDGTRPADMPPRMREHVVRLRLGNHDLMRERVSDRWIEELLRRRR
jgi:hypothetical protein